MHFHHRQRRYTIAKQQLPAAWRGIFMERAARSSSDKISHRPITGFCRLSGESVRAPAGRVDAASDK